MDQTAELSENRELQSPEFQDSLAKDEEKLLNVEGLVLTWRSNTFTSPENFVGPSGDENPYRLILGSYSDYADIDTANYTTPIIQSMLTGEYTTYDIVDTFYRKIEILEFNGESFPSARELAKEFGNFSDPIMQYRYIEFVDELAKRGALTLDELMNLNLLNIADKEVRTRAIKEQSALIEKHRQSFPQSDYKRIKERSAQALVEKIGSERIDELANLVPPQDQLEAILKKFLDQDVYFPIQTIEEAVKLKRIKSSDIIKRVIQRSREDDV